MEYFVELEIDNDLIKEAQLALDRQPKTIQEQIERWAWIGKAAAGQLTEEQIMNLQLGNGELTFTKTVKD